MGVADIMEVADIIGAGTTITTVDAAIIERAHSSPRRGALAGRNPRCGPLPRRNALADLGERRSIGPGGKAFEPARFVRILRWA